MLYYFVKNGDVAKLRVITTGIQDDSNIEITSGLKEDDEVITGPYSIVSSSLVNGEKVRKKSDSDSEKSRDRN